MTPLPTFVCCHRRAVCQLPAPTCPCPTTPRATTTPPYLTFPSYPTATPTTVDMTAVLLRTVYDANVTLPWRVTCSYTLWCRLCLDRHARQLPPVNTAVTAITATAAPVTCRLLLARRLPSSMTGRHTTCLLYRRLSLVVRGSVAWYAYDGWTRCCMSPATPVPTA